MSMYRFGIVGAGPSGIFTAQGLKMLHPQARIDVIDRVPTPFGLVRHGVAPDHQRMKGVVDTFGLAFSSGDINFLGNVNVGREVRLEELLEIYDQVVLATGAVRDRRLGIAGEDLSGVYGSTDVVGWYSGHPEFESPPVLSTQLAIVGGGNVALDLARVTCRGVDELARTDVPDVVLEPLRASPVTDVHVIIRRGPLDAKFTPVELKQLGEVRGLRVLVHDDGWLAESSTDGDASAQQRANVSLLRAYQEAPADRWERTAHLRFFRSPADILGSTAVEGLNLQCVPASPAWRKRGMDLERLDVGSVIRSIGYRGEQLPGVPFDTESGTVPNHGGRVVGGIGGVGRLFVVGWIKRGPSGVIGSNKADAKETVQAMAEDLPNLRLDAKARPCLSDLLAARGVEVVDWNAWLRLDAHERSLGHARQSPRAKLSSRTALLSAARAGRV